MSATVLPYASLKTNLAKTLRQVCENHAPVIVTRANADPVVMLSLEDFEAIEGTHYLLKSPANAIRLAEAIDEIEMMIEKKN
jgi:antitoxin YefM